MKKKENLATEEDFFKTRKDRVALIWISCLSANKTTKEIQDDWDYSRGALYRDGLIVRMLEYGLLQDGGLKAFHRGSFKSSFRSYFKLTKTLGLFNPVIYKNSDEWQNFLSLPKVREAFFNLQSLKLLFSSENEDTKQNIKAIAERARAGGLEIPVLVAISMAYVMFFLRKYYVNSKNLPIAMPFFRAFIPQFPGINIERYLEEVFKKFPIEEIDNYPELKKTAFFQDHEKRLKPIERQLRAIAVELKRVQ